MDISVIIPTRNRAELLDKALDSLTKQALDNHKFEALIVDNGSEDNTKDICAKYHNKLPLLKYIYHPKPGLHEGRHRGLKESKASILVFADDDIEAFPSWLSSIVEAFSDSKVGLVGGKILPRFQSSPPPWLDYLWRNQTKNKVLGHLSLIDLGEVRKKISPTAVFGCDFAIRKQIIFDAGGFHPDGMPKELIRYRGDGESYISRYIETHSYITLYDPKASVYHFVPEERMSFDYFYTRSYNQGISNSYSDIRFNRGQITKSLLSKKLDGWNNYIKKNFDYISDKIISPNDNVLLQRVIAKGYKEGYNFHQSQVSKDPNLLKWVLKKDYLD